MMGQAVVDLPDPLENRPEPAGGNDELLSQLAGEEIDRLLADEAESPPDAPRPTEADLSADASNPPNPLVPDEDSENLPPPPDFQSLVSEQSEDEAAASADAAAPHEIESVDPSDGAGQAERSALEIDSLEDALDEAIASEAAQAAVPWLLRPLVWINAPLDLLPENARAGVGKIALVTLLNAIAIFIYVLIFRSR